eukprot:TRINITY_DN24419_c0_g1_i2.p1 TRINITY_DN24419_c0_g1~~TRINITY_DN24419_c0_g1_i2.p1  ORF type:complete len:335 (+),score=120.60 TRINITY_DN24419_c0_g1_i2:28-1005(+)
MSGEGFKHEVVEVIDEEEPVRLQRAERVLRGRMGNVTLVIEKCSNEFNQQAVVRTAEAMGVQRVYLVRPTLPKRHASQQKKRAKEGKGAEFEWGAGIGVTSGCERWLTLKYFQTTAECIAALKEENHAIWATDLAIEAVCLDEDFRASEYCPSPLPSKVALVMGSEAEGVSKEMLDVADLRVYLPMHGFTDSFNIGVAAALALQKVTEILGREPLPPAEMDSLRQAWIQQLCSNPTITETLKSYIGSSKVPTPLDDLREGRGNPEGPRIIKKVKRRQEEAEMLRAQAAAEKTAEPKQFAMPAYTAHVVLAAVTFSAGYMLGRRRA